MENNGTVPEHSHSLGFDIDPSMVTLAKIFSASMYCLSGATYRMKQKDHSDALRISLIRLRISRLCENHNIYGQPDLESIKEKSDIADAKLAMSQLLFLLDEKCSPSTETPVLRGDTHALFTAPILDNLREMPILLETINNISAKRVPPEKEETQFPRIKDYQGHPSWSMEQYKIAAQAVRRSEVALGIGGLSDLSAHDHEEIKARVAPLRSEMIDVMWFLLEAAKDTDDEWLSRACEESEQQPLLRGTLGGGLAGVVHNSYSYHDKLFGGGK